MEKKNMICQYCGGTEFVETVANFSEARIRNPDLMFKSTFLWHSVCLSCGTVVRSYVEDVEQLRPKKEKERSEEGNIERKLKDFFLQRESEENEDNGRNAQENWIKSKSSQESWRKRDKDPWE